MTPEGERSVSFFFFFGQFLFIDSVLAARGFIFGNLDWFPGLGLTSIVIWKHRNSPVVVPDWVRHWTPFPTAL